MRSVSRSPPHLVWATTLRRFIASLLCFFSSVMCFPKLSFESHQSPRNFVVSSTGNATWRIIMLGCRSGLRLGAVKCSILHLCAANLKPFCSAHPWIASTACWRCLSMAWRELPRKQMAKSSTNRALKISGGIWRGKSLILRPKQVTANTPPVGTPSSVPNSSDRVTPTRTLNLRSLRYWETKMGSLPLNPALCKSRMIPYCQVVSYAFSRSKKRPTACCLWAKASRTYLSCWLGHVSWLSQWADGSPGNWVRANPVAIKGRGHAWGQGTLR